MALNPTSSKKNVAPTDDELLQSFLSNKINNKPFPNHIIIHEYELFGTEKNPWEIWEEFETFHSNSERDLYFFTTLKKKFPTSKKSCRTIGIGHWEGEDRGKPIFAKDTNKFLGSKKRYRFEKSDTYQDGGWILHEYTINKIDHPDNNIVLCRFRKNLKLHAQSIGTRTDHPSNLQSTNCTTLPGKNTKTKNVTQNRKRKAIALECAPTTISGNHALLSIPNEPKTQSNVGHNTTNVVNQSNVGHNTTNVVKTKAKFNEEGMRNTWPKRNIVMGLKSSTKGNGDIFKNKKDDDTIMEKEDGDLITNKEDDSELNMSWSKYFAMELLKLNEECVTNEEEIQMLSNDFFKELLMERIDFSKYCNSRIYYKE